MEVIDPRLECEAQDGQDEVQAVVAGHEGDIGTREDARKGTWEQVESWPPGAGLVDEVLLEALLGVGTENEDDGEQEEVLLGADDGRPAVEVGVLEAGAVDADVGDAQRVGEADGDPDGVARAGGGIRGGGVGVVGDIRQRFEKDPGAGGRRVGARERRGSAGGGEDLVDGVCIKIEHRARRLGGGRLIGSPGLIGV